MTIDDIIALIYSILQNPIFVQYGLVGLFVHGMLASIIVPLPTEITVFALLASGHDKLVVFAVLTIGTYVGGFVGYWIGRSGNKLFQFLKGKPKNEDEDRSYSILRKYGWIAIAGSSWIPIVGDLVPIVAGTKKYDLYKFAIALSIGKVTKSLAVVYLTGLLLGKLIGG